MTSIWDMPRHRSGSWWHFHFSQCHLSQVIGCWWYMVVIIPSICTAFLNHLIVRPCHIIYRKYSKVQLEWKPFHGVWHDAMMSESSLGRSLCIKANKTTATTRCHHMCVVGFWLNDRFGSGLISDDASPVLCKQNDDIYQILLYAVRLYIVRSSLLITKKSMLVLWECVYRIIILIHVDVIQRIAMANYK